jgi:pyruvate dehydrogenase E1 component beta subunit
VVAHESCRTAGLGAEIVARVAEQLHGQLRAPIRRVTTPDVILPANTALEKALVPDTDSVVAAIENLLGG